MDTQYDSLQVALNKPFTHGFLVKGAYTLSKAMNDSDGDGATTLTFNTPSQVDRNWAVAGFDRTHNFQLGFAYQLPWQGSYDNIAKAVLNDWQINGVFGAFSGTPFTVTASGTSLNTPSNQQTADLVGDVKTLGKIGNSGTYFDPAAWRSQPASISETLGGTSSVDRGLDPRLLAVPLLPDLADRSGWRRGFRARTS